MGVPPIRFSDGSGTVYRVVGMAQRFLVQPEVRDHAPPTWIDAATLRDMKLEPAQLPGEPGGSEDE